MQLFSGIYHKDVDLLIEIYLDLNQESYQSEVLIDGINYPMIVEGKNVRFNGDCFSLSVRQFDSETIVSGKSRRWLLLPCLFENDFFVATNKTSYS